MPAWPFTYGFPPRPLAPAWPLRRLRGPVGGVAPIRDAEDVLRFEDEEVEAAAAEDPWREFNNARGARGGALPDIDEHGAREGERRADGKRDVNEVVVVGQAASPCDFAPWATSWAAVALFRPMTVPFLTFVRALMKYAHISSNTFFRLLLLAHMENGRYRTTCRKIAQHQMIQPPPPTSYTSTGSPKTSILLPSTCWTWPNRLRKFSP